MVYFIKLWIILSLLSLVKRKFQKFTEWVVDAHGAVGVISVAWSPVERLAYLFFARVINVVSADLYG